MVRDLRLVLGDERRDADSGYRVYHFDVIQQPQRARACGFGDKVSRAAYQPRETLLTP
jgi:hypothetical protein